MDENSNSADASDIADRIAGLQAEELRDFVQNTIRQRSFHRVVANLNETALSKKSPASVVARKALRRLGFTD
jgi:hypothetical protein